jgi:hypothetical protein
MLNKKARQEHEMKIKEVIEGGKEPVKVNYDFSDEDLQTALGKLTEASMKYDHARKGKPETFEPATLTPLDFRRALRGTFNVNLTPSELGALICTFDKEGTGNVRILQ